MYIVQVCVNFDIELFDFGSFLKFIHKIWVGREPTSYFQEQTRVLIFELKSLTIRKISRKNVKLPNKIFLRFCSYESSSYIIRSTISTKSKIQRNFRKKYIFTQKVLSVSILISLIVLKKIISNEIFRKILRLSFFHRVLCYTIENISAR